MKFQISCIVTLSHRTGKVDPGREMQAAQPVNIAPLIIEVAVNGETRQERNPHAPRSPEEIAAGSIACLGRGAALLHNHIDDPFMTGEKAAACYGAGWSAVLAQCPDAVLCPTMAAGTSHADRISHFEDCAKLHGARMAPLDPGSMNMPLAGGAAGEAEVLSYINTYDEIETVLAMLTRLGMGASMGIYEPGFLRAATAFQRAGKMPPGSLVKLYFFGGRNYFDGENCVGFGLDPTSAALDAYLEILGDCGLPWAVAVVGGCVFETGIAEMAIERGGHIRLGLEDYAGERTPSNLELLDQVASLAVAKGRSLASSREAAAMLGLPR